jgi:uncharacterized protein YgbK (DUF1537 family)
MPPVQPVWIFADDLTGSADAALPFWRAGRRAHVLFDPTAPWPENPGVLSLCTHTRAMNETDAASTLRNLARRLPPEAFVFKKIDSTLRGWIGAESSALLDAMPNRDAIFAPTYPSRGRTLGPDGIYRVHGVPLALTEFAPETTGLPADSTLPAFITRHFGARAPQVRTLAAENDEELHAAAAAVRSAAIWIGSPGLAISLAGPTSRPRPAPTPPTQIPGAAIVVAAGSRRTVTQRQVTALTTAVPAGLTLLRPPDTRYDPAQANAFAEDLGARAAAAAGSLGRCGLILTGGDIAAATCRHLGILSAEIVGEVEDGLPILRAGNTFIVTKAGGFGDDHSLVRAYHSLRLALS